MELLHVQLCVVVECRDCHRKTAHLLPLQPGDGLACICGREVPVGSHLLNTVEALQARYLSHAKRSD